MAGLGRRTHYRKHLTDSVLNDLPEPGEGELIAKIIATRGSNQFDILVSGEEEESTKLAILPTKFRKLVWVKRNAYVIVQTGVYRDDEEEEKRHETGIRYMITHILYKDQVKHLKSKGIWPEDDPFKDGAGADEEPDEIVKEENGIVYNDYDEDLDSDLFVNTNRVKNLQIADSSDEETSDEEG